MLLTWSTVLIKPCSSLDWRATVSIAFLNGRDFTQQPFQKHFRISGNHVQWCLELGRDDFQKFVLDLVRVGQLFGLALAAVVKLGMMDCNGRLAGESRYKINFFRVKLVLFSS